ncbi:sentrin/SUMO-specific protease 15 [Capsaspora owczarzaki ATCC 30864]|nr:sentrin/SUMO-specific protease 15 [Capsaspora owczarzaki ATCC 30864]|eukprot:XP_004348373.1 sentrin/SUMO-specific protease 15 [Capsaspora owczarzaki ATCC 30864]
MQHNVSLLDVLEATRAHPAHQYLANASPNSWLLDASPMSVASAAGDAMQWSSIARLSSSTSAQQQWRLDGSVMAIDETDEDDDEEDDDDDHDGAGRNKTTTAAGAGSTPQYYSSSSKPLNASPARLMGSAMRPPLSSSKAFSSGLSSSRSAYDYATHNFPWTQGNRAQSALVSQPLAFTPAAAAPAPATGGARTAIATDQEYGAAVSTAQWNAQPLSPRNPARLSSSSRLHPRRTEVRVSREGVTPYARSMASPASNRDEIQIVSQTLPTAQNVPASSILEQAKECLSRATNGVQLQASSTTKRTLSSILSSMATSLKAEQLLAAAHLLVEKAKRQHSAISRNVELPVDSFVQTRKLVQRDQALEAQLHAKMYGPAVEVVEDISGDALQKVRAAFGPGHPTEVLVSAGAIQLTRKDFSTLTDQAWLNDEIVNAYMDLMNKRSTNAAQDSTSRVPKVHAFSSFFYPQLLAKGYPGVRRWTRNVDLFSKDFIVVPVHLDVHWCLAVFDMKRQVLDYYDSMGGINSSGTAALVAYLHQESLDKRQQALPADVWVSTHQENIPEQRNGYDCGVFMCQFAERVTRSAALDFSQSDMQSFRRRMAFELLEMRLLK